MDTSHSCGADMLFYVLKMYKCFKLADGLLAVDAVF